MSDWRTGRWAAFDIESTGVDTETARIVTAAIVTTTDTPDTMTNVLIDPGIDIPEQATAVHGITTDHARQHGTTPELGIEWIVDRIRDLWAEMVPVVIYNAPYDLTLLDRESRRHLGHPFTIAGPVIDPLVIDKAVDPYRKGSRKLVDTCHHWDVPFDENAAHGAIPDALGALALGQRIVRDWDTDKADLRTLYRNQQTWYKHQRESFAAYLARKGETLDDPSTAWPIRPRQETTA